MITKTAKLLALLSVVTLVSSVSQAEAFTGPEPVGWYAGDMHVHRSCGGSPEAVSSLFQKMDPQNLSVISLLADMGNAEVKNSVTDLPLVTGQDASISTTAKVIHWDAEWHWDPTYYQYPHQALGGHVVALGLNEAHQIFEEYTYPVFNWAHQQNGIAGFVHMQYLDNNIPQSLTCCTPIEYPVEVALGSVDFIAEDVQDADSSFGMCPECATQAYYRLLNCGFRPGLAAGTDYPCNSSNPLGSLLTYVQVADGQMTYRNWIEGIAAGRTVVSRNGHNEFINLTVNGSAAPGDEIKLPAAGSVQVTIQWTATQVLSGQIELLHNGVVVASQQASVAPGAPASLNVAVEFAKSGWLAARRMGANGHMVHTAAVFVTVNNAPVRASAADAQFYVQWMDNLLAKTSPGGEWNSYFPNNLTQAQARYRSAKAIYQQIAAEAAPQLSVSSASLANGTKNIPYTAALTASGGIQPYTWSIASGLLPGGLSLDSASGVISGTPSAGGTFNFSVLVADSVNPPKTATKELSITCESGGPILIITSYLNPFSGYYTEILRNEGFNSFAVSDLSNVTSALLGNYDVVLLGETALTTSQVTMLTDWVTAGGNLIAMRPDKKLAGLLGLTDKGSTLSNAYLQVDTSGGPGFGIVNQSIQFHGDADRYTTSGSSKLATLYFDANTASSDPAVTLKDVGNNGGQAAAFTYDLARSVVYTRQGNPAWAGQVRDGLSPIRSSDLFFGAASFDPQPDWVDLEKVAIPQADEQQRLLANMIIRMNLDKKPLPRFWYLPRSLPATVIMTGDDHGSLYSGGGGATAARFDQFQAASPQDCAVDNWECVRGTSYLLSPVVASNPLTDVQAAAYVNAGFEIGVHVDSVPDCSNWTPGILDSSYTTNLSSFASAYPSVPAPNTHRMHCVSWSDYDSQPKSELNHGIRLDTTYYYYPGSWVNDRPGLFTGSGLPMRFSDANGNLIDVYQAATQLTDESGQSYPSTVDTLLDRAIGPEGYYGVFTANAHTDIAVSGVSDAVVNSALARGIPVISARQMLTWLDGRNSSVIDSIVWNGGTTLGFSVNAAQGGNGLTAMVPVPVGQMLAGITKDGSSIDFTTATIKGIQYARFLASTGTYQVSYAIDISPPTVTSVSPVTGATGVGITTNPAVTFSDLLDPATVVTDTFELRDPANSLVAATVTYYSSTGIVTITPAAALANSTTYTARIKGGTSGVRDLTGNPLAADYRWSFTTAAQGTGPFTIWPDTSFPTRVADDDTSATALGVKFRSDTAGAVTGIRFYKGSTNTGQHIGNLWTYSGTLLATATFANETASGWQQVSFPAPVDITANTVYVASYHTSSGHYSEDANYFNGKGKDSSPLHALADGVSGANGVFAYGPSSVFPNQPWNASNYWVDVVFTNKLDQAITFDAVAPKVLGAADFDPGASASSGLAVTYSSSDTAVATIVAGKVHLVSAGITTITANQSGNGNYNAAPGVSRPLDVVAATANTLVSRMPYNTFSEAYNAAVSPTSDGVIYARDIPFGESINLSNSKAIKIRGGYDINYLNQTGYSQLKSLTVSNGLVVVDRLVIKPE